METPELTREVWTVDAGEFPDDAPIEEQARFLLRYAILAPSSHNSQPWRFSVDGERIRIAADEDRWLTVADPDKRELSLSVGCAVENLRVAAERFGFDPRIDYETDPETAAVAILGSDERSPPGEASALFAEITERYTSHERFEDRPIPEAALDRLAERVGESDVALTLIDDPELRESIGALQAEADVAQMNDPEYRRELGHWIGIGALGSSWLAARIGQTVVTHFDLGEREGKKNSVLVESAPVLAVLSTRTDDPPARIRAGQAYERLALAASVEDVAVHPMSQILERPELRSEIADAIGLGESLPQHLFRLGYADEEPSHTPRWPLEAFLAE